MSSAIWEHFGGDFERALHFPLLLMLQRRRPLMALTQSILSWPFKIYFIKHISFTWNRGTDLLVQHQYEVGKEAMTSCHWLCFSWIHRLLRREGEEVRSENSSDQLELDLLAGQLQFVQQKQCWSVCPASKHKQNKASAVPLCLRTSLHLTLQLSMCWSLCGLDLKGRRRGAGKHPLLYTGRPVVCLCYASSVSRRFLWVVLHLSVSALIVKGCAEWQYKLIPGSQHLVKQPCNWLALTSLTCITAQTWTKRLAPVPT